MMSKRETETFVCDKSRAIKAARQLGYAKEFITEMKRATTLGELQRIQKRAREVKFG